ncbi:DUF4252 domain-containing protein [Croceiramulus getboli]|nr:DUF4252 domain-containing protein [Flavobacteriaceae bacterium YJPT1-3]
MTKLIQLTIGLFLSSIVLISCSNEQSLQEYYVSHQENSDFVMLDVPMSLISQDTDKLTPEQKKVINSVKKINMLAYPLSKGTQEKYEAEKAQIKTILAGDDYEELMSFGSVSERIKLYFKGEEEAIDEVIVFAMDDTKGLMLARVLGDDMNVGDMVNFAKGMGDNQGNFDLAQFEGVMDVFK